MMISFQINYLKLCNHIMVTFDDLLSVNLIIQLYIIWLIFIIFKRLNFALVNNLLSLYDNIFTVRVPKTYKILLLHENNSLNVGKVLN